MAERQQVQLILKGQIDYSLWGDEKEASGVSKIVLEPVTKTLLAQVGQEVIYRVVAVHRETVET